MPASIRKATLDDWRVAVELIAVELRRRGDNLEKSEQLCSELPDVVRAKITASKVLVAEYNGRLVGAAVGVYAAASSEETRAQLIRAVEALS